MLAEFVSVFLLGACFLLINFKSVFARNFFFFVFSPSSGKIDEQEWRFLLTGGVALENKFPNPASDWLTDKSLAEIVRCSALPSFRGILNHFTEHVSRGNAHCVVILISTAQSLVKLP